MSAITLGLNNSEGTNRIRFENLSQRLQKINVDILHKVHDNSTVLQVNNNDPDSGSLGCFFQDELEQLKKLETSSHFKKFQFEVQPYVQSLPELLHHQSKVVSLIENQIVTSPAGEIQSYLHLVAILAKDLNEDLGQHFHSLFGTILKVVNAVAHSGTLVKGKRAPNPELTGKLFECLSYLLKSQLGSLAKDPDSLRQYYGAVLGNSTHYVRNMGAKAFIIVIRKLPLKVFKSHTKRLLAALATNGKATFSEHLGSTTSFESLPLESKAANPLCAGNKRIFDLLEGVAEMMFYTVKGVKGCLHSKGTERLAELLSAVSPVGRSTASALAQEIKGASAATPSAKSSKKGSKQQKASESAVGAKVSFAALSADIRSQLEAAGSSDSRLKVFCAGQVVDKCVVKALRHVHPTNAAELWMVVVAATSDCARVLVALDGLGDVPSDVSANVDLATLALVEVLLFAMCHSSGRGLSDPQVKSSVGGPLINTCLDLCTQLLGAPYSPTRSEKLISRTRTLFCRLWMAYPSHSSLIQRVDSVLRVSLPCLLPTPAVVDFASELLPALPDAVIQRHLVRPMIAVIAELSAAPGADETRWLCTLLEVLLRLTDCRDVFTPAGNANVGTVNMSSRGQARKDDVDGPESWGMSDESEGDSDADDESSVTSSSSSSSGRSNSDLDGEGGGGAARTVGSILEAGSSADLAAISLVCLRLVSARLDASLATQSSVAADDVAAIVAIKCLRWVLTVAPAAANAADFTTHLGALTEKVTGLFRRSDERSADMISAPFLAHLLAFSSFTLAPTAKSNVKELKLVTRNVVAYFRLRGRSVALSWAVGEFLQSMSPHLQATHDSPLLSSVLTAGEQEELVDFASECLATPSYWLRFNTLKILTHLPAPQLKSVAADKKGATPKDEHQAVDVASICLEVSTLSSDITTEREYARLLGTLEVLMRAGRLPQSFVRLVCAFCLGLVHVKFKSIWEPALLVLVSAASHAESEEVLWPLLLRAVRTIGAQGVEKQAKADCEALDQAPVESGRLSSWLADCVRDLAAVDCGSDRVSMDLATSDAFYYIVQAGTRQNRLLVEPDARTDVETAFGTVWSVLKRCPAITLKRSKVVVPLFINFLARQYYAVFCEDPEIPFLRRSGFFDEATRTTTADEHSDVAYPVLPVRTLKRRLEMFLQVLAAVTSPKQLFRHQTLYTYYLEILSKPDAAVVKLALDCVLGYKAPALVPYKDNVRRLLEDKTLRDELVNLDLSLRGGAVKIEHREELIPLLVRVVFGRFVSKSRGSKAAREQGLARRAAALSFLSKMEPQETRHLVQLMVRGVIPSALLNENAMRGVVVAADPLPMSVQLTQWYDVVDAVLRDLSPQGLIAVQWERQVGFLHLLEQAVKVVGFGLTEYVAQIHAIVLKMVVHAQATRVEACANTVTANEEHTGDLDEEGDEEGDEDAPESGDAEVVAGDSSDRRALAVQFKNASQSARVRTLCLLRVAEMVHQYHAVFRFDRESEGFFSAVEPLVAALPSSISGSSKAPAMLRIFHALVSYEQTIGIVAQRPDSVRAVILCVASQQAEPAVVFMVMEALNALLDYNDGVSILPHAKLIIQSFSRRFVGPQYDSLSELKLSEMHITPSGSVKQELKLLCRIAEGIFSRSDVQIDSLAVTNLATLLLGMLRTYTTSRKVRVEEDWAINILRIYRSLLWRVEDVSQHVSFVSRLFGPASHSLSLFNYSTVRAELGNVYDTLAGHASTKGLLDLSGRALRELTAEDPKLIGAKDFGRVMPAFQSLSGETREAGDITWSNLLGPGATPSPRVASMCSAVVYEVLRCMYDAELIVRSAALACLKRLVVQCGQWSGCLPAEEDSAPFVTSADCDPLSWLDILRSVVMPAIRRGIKQSSDVVKKNFVALLAHVVGSLGGVAAVAGDDMFHCDLGSLLHEDPEQSFFENITHIQHHRRMRAMNKLRAALTAEAEADPQAARKHAIGASSLVHVLLPLAYHLLFSDEFQKKDHQALMQEAAHFVGSVGLHLQWNHYFAAVKTLLKQLGRGRAEKEKVLLSALCALLDAFHFDLSGEKALEGLVMLDNAHLQDRAKAQPVKGARKGDAIGGPVDPDLLPKGGDAVDGNDSDHGSVENGAAPDPAAELGLVSEVADEAGDADEAMEVVEADDEMEAEVEAAGPSRTAPEESYLTISRAVVNNILPWVKQFLLKEGKDHKGNKSFTVQPHVALALTKLIRRLEPPVVSESFRAHLFTNLVISVVTTLKSRDSSSRDVARESLSRMISTLGLSSMKSVLFELTMILREGFQRHVCNYTVKSILQTAMADYVPPGDAPSVPLELMTPEAIEQTLDSVTATVPDFDRCVPLIVSCVLDDLTGDAQDDRSADSALRSLIREAKGSKANDTLEITARCLLFRPTYALLNPKKPADVSSIHGLTVPLLDLLVNNDSSELMGRVAEALQRVALGLSRNPSVDAKELLLYLHATLQPFVAALVREFDAYRRTLGQIAAQQTASGKRRTGPSEEELDFAALDEALPSYLREESSDEDERALYSQKKTRHDDVTGFRASTWLPSDRRALQEQRAVVEERNRAQQERYKVQDGASAPKLSGHNRYNRNSQGTNKRGNKGSGIAGAGGAADPSSLAAIRFCLTLFNSCLRQDRLDSRSEEIRAMAVPFLPLLGKCLQLPGASSVVALAVKCITTLVGWGIPIEPAYLRALSNRLLRLMFSGGGLVSTDNELAQACIKGLTGMFKLYNSRMAAWEERRRARKDRTAAAAAAEGEAEEDFATTKPDIPLGEANIRSLLQMLTVSVTEVTSSYQNAAFQLIKEVVGTRIVVPEVYDLMTKLAEQIVLSQRKGVREAASSIVVSFLINYPLGDRRVESQVKQLVNSCAYEYEDGRLAALDTLSTLVKLLPPADLERYQDLIFLPVTLRVVNDNSGKCRVAAGDLLVLLCSRVDAATFAKLQQFALSWLGTSLATSADGSFDTTSKSLVRTGAQVTGLLARARPDLLSRVVGAVVQLTSASFSALLRSEEAGASGMRGSIWKREMSKFAEGHGDAGGSDAWAVIYQLLVLIESFYQPALLQPLDRAILGLEALVVAEDGREVLFMEQVQEAMLYPHAWVRAAAVRVVHQYLSGRGVDRAALTGPSGGREILTAPNGLYHLARRLCVVLNQPTLPSAMLDSLGACLVFAIRAMQRSPDLSAAPANEENDGDDDDGDDKEEEQDPTATGDSDHDDAADSGEESDTENTDEALSSPEAAAGAEADLGGANWAIQRLRGIGADSRGDRRVNVMRVFLSLVESESPAFVAVFVQQIIEVAVRASLAADRLGSLDEAAVKATKEVSAVLLSAIEAKVGAAVFIGAFGVVQRAIQSSKSERKRQLAAEAITNPQSHALRKIAHAMKKKESRKRKNERHALQKGIKKPRAKSTATAIIDHDD